MGSPVFAGHRFGGAGIGLAMLIGGLVMLITWIPLANLFLIPGAVAGAVLMWDRHYRGTPDTRDKAAGSAL